MSNHPATENPSSAPVPASSAAVPAGRAGYERPLSGLFAINKPSGKISMGLLESLKELFMTSKLFVDEPEGCGGKTPAKPKRGKFGRKRRQPKQLKIGQGGTLDPLASGVLVIGLNAATKRLADFLHSSKVYRTTGLLGCRTDSYDRDGKVVRLAGWKHVTPALIVGQCQALQGEHWQIPPIYSALKMDGVPLYEYARNNRPLPRPIDPRRCEILDIKMTQWLDPGTHPYRWPTETISEDERKMFEKVEQLVTQTAATNDPVVAKNEEAKGEVEKNPAKNEGDSTNAPVLNGEQEEVNQLDKSACKRPSSLENEAPGSKKIKLDDDPNPLPLPTADPATTKDESDKKVNDVTMEDNGSSPAFTLEMTVSSGTYVRTIVHDIGQAVSSAATVVSLIRTRQGDFSLDGPARGGAPGVPGPETKETFGCIEWRVFEQALQNLQDGVEEPRNQDGLHQWEVELLKFIKL